MHGHAYFWDTECNFLLYLVEWVWSVFCISKKEMLTRLLKNINLPLFFHNVYENVIKNALMIWYTLIF